MDQKMGQRKFFTSASSRKIQCEHHLVAGLFVCGKFLRVGTGSSKTLRRRADPYTVVRNFLRFPATYRQNNLFLLKFSPSLFQKAGSFCHAFFEKTGKFHYDCSNRCRFRAFSSHREVDTRRSVLSFARSHSTAYMNRFPKGDQAPLRPYSGRS